METIILSERLQAVANMVTPNNHVCDVGCDHGFVSIYLVQNHITDKVIAMDVRTGPLQRAVEHVKEQQLEEYITCRLSDGIQNMVSGEADSMICAGMGGPLMLRILGADKGKTSSFKELILQPQSEIESVRSYVRNNGFMIVEENMVYEEGKFYPMFRAIPNEGVKQEATDDENRYGAILLDSRHPVLYDFLLFEYDMYQNILNDLRSHDLSTKRQLERIQQIEDELRQNEHIRSKFYAV